VQRIGFVVLPGFQVMSLAALSVFEFANKEMDEPVYDVSSAVRRPGRSSAARSASASRRRGSAARDSTTDVGRH